MAVLGAGPVGLEAAAATLARGWRVTVIERGEVGEHVREWGHVRLFSPFGLNAGPHGRARLAGTGTRLPPDDAVMSGYGFRDGYLLPLAETLAESATVRAATRVVTVARSTLFKGDAIGAPERAADPFRILMETRAGEELVEADVVLDCTGTWGRPNPLGAGGAPALGERALRPRIRYGLPDIGGEERAEFAGARVLVVGSGHSAASVVVALAALAAEVPGTGFVWVVRSGDVAPYPARADDPLPERRGLERSANALAATTPAGSRVLRCAQVAALEERAGALDVTLRTPAGVERVRVDRVIAATGGEPDDSLYRQLQIHECYASRAPMKLAAHLLAGEGGDDCLSTGGGGPELLRNPEPGYFIIGSKSFGRNSAFLLRTGYDQVADVVDALLVPQPPAPSLQPPA